MPDRIPNAIPLLFILVIFSNDNKWIDWNLVWQQNVIKSHPHSFRASFPYWPSWPGFYLRVLSVTASTSRCPAFRGSPCWTFLVTQVGLTSGAAPRKMMWVHTQSSELCVTFHLCWTCWCRANRITDLKIFPPWAHGPARVWLSI